MTHSITRLAVMLAVVNTFLFVDAQFSKKKNYPLSDCDEDQPKLVTVQQGEMRGSTMISDSGKKFCSFRGIPFAAPPVGQYRFQPPRPPKRWKGVLDATEEGPDCIQLSMYGTAVQGQEDCLYLNVYTPKIKPEQGKLFDVIVWIFGGLFYTGSASTITIGPDYLIEMDLVVVVISHRLGAFGFLSTGDDESPGNYGMKDQVAALQWVKGNIEAFGGNSSSVTIVGLSSGAASVHYHILSPLSKGLFHRGISFEGTAINSWAKLPNPLSHAQKQARFVGCPTEPTSCLVSCLKEMDATELTNSFLKMFPWLVLPTPGYAPVPETLTERNPHPFITDDPLALMRDGKFQRVPWLMGGTSQGSGSLAQPIIIFNTLRNYVNKYNAEVLPQLMLLNYSVPQDQVDNITNIVLDYYLGKEHILTVNERQRPLNMFSDRMLIHPVHKTAQLHVLAGHREIYKYNFAYTGAYSLTQGTTLQNYGTAHGDEMIYLLKKYGGKMPFPSNDEEVRLLLLYFVKNFARYGNPTPANQTGNGLVDMLNWMPTAEPEGDFEKLRYLNIGQVVTNPSNRGYLNLGLGPVKINMAEDLYKERMDFWDALPLYENCLPYCD